ncbi:MAG: general secretion pathway protein GspE, partial [Thiovulaceae bacterium]|nr:general secretion pathway protein GspE [Sulfurimonadaceae bacterium]
NLLEKIATHIMPETQFYKGKGCSHCEMTGYSGRVLISEILHITEEISKMIAAESSNSEIAHYAQEHEQFEPMILDGIKKATQGITSLDEVLRVVKDI